MLDYAPDPDDQVNSLRDQLRVGRERRRERHSALKATVSSFRVPIVDLAASESPLSVPEDFCCGVCDEVDDDERADLHMKLIRESREKRSQSCDELKAKTTQVVDDLKKQTKTYRRVNGGD